MFPLAVCLAGCRRGKGHCPSLCYLALGFGGNFSNAKVKCCGLNLSYRMTGSLVRWQICYGWVQELGAGGEGDSSSSLHALPLLPSISIYANDKLMVTDTAGILRVLVTT